MQWICDGSHPLTTHSVLGGGGVDPPAFRPAKELKTARRWNVESPKTHYAALVMAKCLVSVCTPTLFFVKWKMPGVT